MIIDDDYIETEESAEKGEQTVADQSEVSTDANGLSDEPDDLFAPLEPLNDEPDDLFEPLEEESQPKGYNHEVVDAEATTKFAEMPAESVIADEPRVERQEEPKPNNWEEIQQEDMDPEESLKKAFKFIGELISGKRFSKTVKKSAWVLIVIFFMFLFNISFKYQMIGKRKEIDQLERELTTIKNKEILIKAQITEKSNSFNIEQRLRESHIPMTQAPQPHIQVTD